MTKDELKQAAIDYLGQAFNAENLPPVHLIQAAVSLVLTSTPDEQMPDIAPITLKR